MLRLAVPDLISNSYFPAVAAVELGFLKAQGIEASVELIYPVPKAMEALRDNRVDLVAGAAHSTLSAFTEWRGAKLLASLAQHMYWFLVVRSDLTAERGDVHSVKGLRIGAAPGPDQALLQLLRDCGLSPERDGIRIGPVSSLKRASVSFGVSAANALKRREIDAFWANGMGAEIAVRTGIGKVVLDVRRGDGPPAARSYTFPALVASDGLIERDPNAVAAAVRALVNVQRALRKDPSLATQVGERLFPSEEAKLIATLVERDAPYYEPAISEATVRAMNHFARQVGLLHSEVLYEDVVATKLSSHWL